MRFAVYAAGLALGGCTLLPAAGPKGSDIIGAASTSDALQRTAFQYALVDISEKVLSALADLGPGSFYASFGAGKGSPAAITVGVGDAVQVTVFESAAGGLFIPADAGARAGNFVQMPAQTVDQSGYITVPYAGMINVKGRSIPEIQRDIEKKLITRAIEPQAIVSLTSQTSSQVTVIGQVSSASKVNINPAGDRVIDVLAKSGGIAHAGYETFVTLQRKQKRATVYFMNLISNSQENIFVQPGDILYVYQDKRSYTAFGASGQSNQFFFEQEHLMLSDAVGKAGGLLDSQADPGQVFLYRLEKRERLDAMPVDLSMFPPELDVIPTIYRVNLRDPSGFFAARSFFVQNRDILYVTNADSVEVLKFLNILNTATNITTNVAATTVAVQALRAR